MAVYALTAAISASTCSGVRCLGSLGAYFCATRGTDVVRLTLVFPLLKREEVSQMRGRRLVAKRFSSRHQLLHEPHNVRRRNFMQVAGLASEPELQEALGKPPTMIDSPLTQSTLIAKIV